MKRLPNTFFHMRVNCMFFLIIPLFYFLFILAYSPFDIEQFYGCGRDRYAFNLIITTLIVLGTVTLSRMLMFILRRVLQLNWPLYILWCTGEVVVAGMMTSLLVALSWGGALPYFQVMSKCLLYMAGILVFPYAILTMAVQMHVLSLPEPQVDDNALVRFHDETGRLKFISAAENILYIEAEENYVHIHHLQAGKEKDLTLRSSMHALEETLSRHGILRCHRSFFINPAHITILRKDSSTGYAFAELDNRTSKNIPVSKTGFELISRSL